MANVVIAMYRSADTIKHFCKCFRAVDFLWLCRGRKNVAKRFILRVTASKTFCKCFILHVTTVLRIRVKRCLF